MSLKEKAFNISTQPDKPLYVVRLEDAQKEIDKLTEQRNIESKIVDRMLKEKEELKQKLQQLVNELPLTYYRDGDRFEFYSLGTKQEWEWWLKKLELLKEEASPHV
jgi:hypothetical protein